MSVPEVTDTDHMDHSLAALINLVTFKNCSFYHLPGGMVIVIKLVLNEKRI